MPGLSSQAYATTAPHFPQNVRVTPGELQYFFIVPNTCVGGYAEPSESVMWSIEGKAQEKIALLEQRRQDVHTQLEAYHFVLSLGVREDGMFSNTRVERGRWMEKDMPLQ